MNLLFRNNFSNLLFDVAESSQSKQEKLKEDMTAGGFMTGRIFCFQVDGPLPGRLISREEEWLMSGNLRYP